jgi:hypothetical protein
MTAPALLESIKRVALGTRSDERLQAAAVGDVDAHREQIREVLRDPETFEETDRAWRSSSIKISMSLVRSLLPRERAKQRSLTNPLLSPAALRHPAAEHALRS